MWQCVQESQQRWCAWYLWLGCGWSRPLSPGRGLTASWQTHALKWSSIVMAHWVCTWEAVGSLMQASTPAPSPAPAIPSPAQHASIWPTVRSTAIPMATPCSGWTVGGGLGCKGLRFRSVLPNGILELLFSLIWVSVHVWFLSHILYFPIVCQMFWYLNIFVYDHLVPVICLVIVLRKLNNFKIIYI